MRNVQALCLAGNALGSAGAAHIAAHLGTLTGLTSLDLSRNALTPAAIWALAPDLARCTALDRLSLAHNPLGVAADDSWAELRAAIGPNPVPNGPEYKYPGLTDFADVARDVALHMKKLGQSLHHLDLTGTGLCPISGRALALQLPKMAALVTLDISGNSMQFGRSKPQLASLSSLRALRLAAGPASRPSKGWWGFLSQLPTLEVRRLSHSPSRQSARLRPRGFRALVALACFFCWHVRRRLLLQVLDVHGFDMANFGRLSPHLTECTKLRVLLLGGGASAFCAPALAAALAPLTALELLNLNNSHLLEPSGDVQLAKTLNRLPALRAVSLSWGLHADEAGLPLTLNLPALSRLFALDISDTAEPWRADDAAPLARKLRRLPRLAVLNYSPAWVAAGAVAELHRAADGAMDGTNATRMGIRDLADVATSALLRGKPIRNALGAAAAK